MKELLAESNAKYEDGNIEDGDKLLKEAQNQNESIIFLQRKMKILRQSLGEEYEEKSVEKPESVAYFEFEDFDKGLNYKIEIF